MSPRIPVVLAGLALALACAGSPGDSASEPSGGGTESPTSPPNAPRYHVSPVQGPSWLKHLGLTISATRMGKMGGTEAAPASGRQEPELGSGESALGQVMGRFLDRFLGSEENASRLLDQPFQLSGADLYRLSCQSCHGPTGEGAPPEIKSLVDPAGGTSPELIMQRIEARGASIDRQMAAQLAAQATEAIRKRLAEGGEKMPPFPHLRGDEVDALLAFLRELAGAPAGEDTRMLVPESAARVGEHLIKGTCHVCHDATGPGGGHMAMMRGIIPSLASFPRELSLSSVERQVEYGSSPMMRHMGGGMMGGGGAREVMPALPFITGPEVAAGYFYLAEYPPES
jgi:mono/diheme cytochrome c family protein